MKKISFKSQGSGKIDKNKVHIGKNVVIEKGVLFFHPENIHIGNNVYIGHNTILKGYYKNKLIIGDNTWIGQNCFLHSAGGIDIGNSVGIAPCVKILTSYHDHNINNNPIIENPILFKKVIIENSCDLGVGSIIMPGCKIGSGTMVGAGTIVTKSFNKNLIIVGNPAKKRGKRMQ